MPSLPKWLADTVENISKKHYHPVRVTHIDYLTPALKLVRFEGNLGHTRFSASNVVEFRVNDTDFRHYTPSRYDSEAGICEILFYLHNKGEGSKWAEKLEINDELKLMGPGGKMSFQPDFSTHFVFGDETSLGLMQCVSQTCNLLKHTFYAIAELQQNHLDWIKHIDTKDVSIVETTFDDPAKNTVQLIHENENFFQNKENTFFYLTGRAKSIQELRKYLILNGVSNKQIQTYPYWAEGKKGL